MFRPEFMKQEVLRLVDSLELFKVGYSWAGLTSLAVAYDFTDAKVVPITSTGLCTHYWSRRVTGSDLRPERESSE